MTEAADRSNALLSWYSTSGRDLPWRSSTDPYPVMVSEVMLQQTQVSRVIPKFGEFLDRWPTIDRLARADLTEVLAVWSGLGYNSRAMRLRDAAAIVAANGWPTSVTELSSLPGIGPYTAAAIASICFDAAVPAIDTNLRRVLGRWAGEPLDRADLTKYAQEALGMPAGDWNQALMDLGSVHCTPRNPTCETCPVADWCTDPSVYEPPPSQSPFAGSRRELRGALLRAHVHNDDLHKAGEELGWSHKDVADTIATIRAEGLLSTG